jgi:diacylglycerol kinase family enzyme
VASYLVVVNPKSGSGRGLARARALAAALPQTDDVEVLETRRRGHAADAAFEQAGSFDRVVAVGGDGTLNEVLTGLVRAGTTADQLPALGFLASGTANAATTAFGLAKDPVVAARAMTASRPKPVDVGVASFAGGRRPFLLWFGAGYDAIVIEALNSKRTGLMGVTGLMRGLPGVVRAVHRYPAPTIRARTADGAEHGGGSVLLANVAAMAFGSTATPAADPHDGHLDLLTVPQTGTLGVAGLWIRMVLSSLDRAAGVERTTLTRVRFEAEGRVPFQLDGEPVGTLPVDVQILPGAVRLLLT